MVAGCRYQCKSLGIHDYLVHAANQNIQIGLLISLSEVTIQANEPSANVPHSMNHLKVRSDHSDLPSMEFYNLSPHQAGSESQTSVIKKLSVSIAFQSVLDRVRR